jgi:hypothetical protein
MRKQAYGNGRTVLYESLVRGCVAYYMQVEESTAAGAKQVKYETSRGFSWTGGLVNLLAEYESDRTKYESFDAFMPRVIEYFSDTAKNIDAAVAGQPKVVSIVPANGAKEVDAATTTEIIITFDRKMRDKSWSLVGGGPAYPKFGQPRFDSACKALHVPVTLEPGKTYEFDLNSVQFKGFASADGTPLEPVSVTFSTAP